LGNTFQWTIRKRYVIVVEHIMDFLINTAHAEGAAPAAQQEPGLFGFLPLIIIFILFYFLLIRPQQKRAKEHKQMVDAIAKGDEVVSGGGLLGKVTDVGESFITLEIANGVSVQVQRSSVATLMPKGTYQSK
jgi:preprotein translocase subunit YajC